MDCDGGVVTNDTHQCMDPKWPSGGANSRWCVIGEIRCEVEEEFNLRKSSTFTFNFNYISYKSFIHLR